MIPIICALIAMTLSALFLFAWQKFKYEMWVWPEILEAVYQASINFASALNLLSLSFADFIAAQRKLSDEFKNFPSGGISSPRQTSNDELHNVRAHGHFSDSDVLRTKK